jgi:hypothetical protein
MVDLTIPLAQVCSCLAVPCRTLVSRPRLSNLYGALGNGTSSLSALLHVRAFWKHEKRSHPPRGWTDGLVMRSGGQCTYCCRSKQTQFAQVLPRFWVTNFESTIANCLGTKPSRQKSLQDGLRRFAILTFMLVP